MEDNFRNILIILSSIVIGAIFVHGLWTIRKEKNPYKLKTSKDRKDPITDELDDRNFDSKGFDRDGVGQIKVSKQIMDSDDVTIQLESPTVSEKSTKSAIDDFLIKEDALPLDVQEDSNQEKSTQIENILEENQEEAALVYQEPVTHAKPVQKVTKKSSEQSPVQSSVKKQSKATLKRNQMEINFGEGIAVTEDDKVQKNKNTDPALAPQIIILSVVMPANHQMSGASLLPSLLTLGMKYGDMDIFHRHQDSAGNGEVSFSLANMVNPGTFDLDSMETFTTQGVSLFMTLPNAGDPFLVFEQMLGAAKQLAQEFGAQILDDKRNVMTKQTEQHYVGKIREYDRQYRIASTK